MNHDPSIQAAVTAALEAAINHALSMDPGSAAALQGLEGKSLSLALQSPELQLFVQLGYPIGIASYSERLADCQLYGSSWAFLNLLKSGQHSLANSAVTQVGDTQLLAALLAIVQNLDIDWEAPLVKWLGDLPGHSLATVLRQQSQWLRQSLHKTPYFIGDYLSQELGLVPNAAEISDFCHQIDDLRAHTDRLSARLALVQAKLLAEASAQ